MRPAASPMIRMLLGVLLVGAFAVVAQAATEPRTLPSAALGAVRAIAIQHNGRYKPFDSFARETLTLITGAPRIGREDPVATTLSMIADPEPWQERPLIAVPFHPLRERLGLPPKASHASYNELLATRKLMRMLPPIVAKQQRDEKLTMLEQETMDMYERFVALSNLFEQRLDLVPPPSLLPGHAWMPILEPQHYAPEQQAALHTQWSALLTAARAGSAGEMDAAARQFSQQLRALNPVMYPALWRLHLEVWYNRWQPFRWARAVYWLAALLLFLSLMSSARPLRHFATSPLPMVVLGLACVLHVAGITLRVVLGGRPPVSNFYETMLWLPFVAVVVALVFERIYRVRYFGLAAAILAGITLVLADHLPLDASISPVVAVLRSNLWLTIHVLTIVASYGALALATVLAHVYGGLYLARTDQRATLAPLELFVYRTIQVGVVLLAAGIMLGAVWANASWGRYWGWDPKETWALITLLWFLAALHGRFAGWLKGVGLPLATIAGFFLLLMTYYGVSFYLVGLHSYAGGHAKPLPSLLISYLIAEVLFMGILGWLAWRSRRLA